MTPQLQLVMSLTVYTAPDVVIGDIGSGAFRRVIPITGGVFTGPRVNGVVLAGGADWNLRHPDGTTDIWARYTLRTDDGAHIGVINAGTLASPSSATELGYTTPTFEVADRRYLYLRGGPFVGTLEPGNSEGEVRLQFFTIARQAAAVPALTDRTDNPISDVDRR